MYDLKLLYAGYPALEKTIDYPSNISHFLYKENRARFFINFALDRLFVLGGFTVGVEDILRVDMETQAKQLEL